LWPDSGDRCLLSDSHIQAIPHLQSWWGSPTSPNFIIQLAMVAAIFLAHLLHSVSRRVMIGGFCWAATYNPSPHLQSWCDSPTSPSFTIQLAMRLTVLLACLLHSIRRRVGFVTGVPWVGNFNTVPVSGRGTYHTHSAMVSYETRGIFSTRGLLA
jgi:hypothetical protein